MIPMTVSYFTKQSKTKASGIRNALLYGFFIIVIYTLLGTAISAIFGSNAMYEFSTGVTFNAIMFIALLVFAFSFLGAFEIMLPNSWVNKVDSGANKGGVVGIFFMALALAVVSFSCTFPIAGTALLDAATKGGIAPIISMLGFSSAIALPFGLFAFFPSWLNSLPKSGGWLNTVKVVLGFLELAFAFKFLSMIDLVLEWHFLEREVFLAIWIAIFGTLGLYLLGKIKLPHDSPLEHISVGRLSMAILALSFTLYMVPGLWGAPLKLISGFPPPMSTNSESPYGVGFMKKQVSASGEFIAKELPKDAHFGPNDLIAFHDYDKGMAYAKTVNKPVMLDFTGLTCVNCRKMEEQVWVEDEIYALLDNDIVLISLYVDDRTKLPVEEQHESEITGNSVKTYGHKWLEFQQTRYNTNAQPLYVIQNLEGEDISPAVGYTPDVEEYYEWLKKGIENFKK
jgi:thiol:disulfide interchange protein DsbD